MKKGGVLQNYSLGSQKKQTFGENHPNESKYYCIILANKLMWATAVSSLCGGLEENLSQIVILKAQTHSIFPM